MKQFLKWLFGQQEQAVVAKPSGPAQIKGTGQHATVADRLDWLANKYKATYTIKRPQGGVVILLDMPDLDVVSSGIKSSTAAAVQVLYDKLEGNK
jgi:hypothetical protein